MSVLSPPPQTRTIGTALVAGKPVPVQADIAWFRYWAQGLFDRNGGAIALSNAELAALIAALQVAMAAAKADIVGLRADLTALEIDLTALAGDVAGIAVRVAAIEAEAMPKALQYDYIDATTAYRGEAEPGALTSAAAWRIQRITITGDDVAIAWAGGSSVLTQIWDNRLSLSYS